MTRFRRKWDGSRWRPGLDLANLGLLILGAIVLKALWNTQALDAWFSNEVGAAARWMAAGLVALLPCSMSLAVSAISATEFDAVPGSPLRPVAGDPRTLRSNPRTQPTGRGGPALLEGAAFLVAISAELSICTGVGMIARS